MGFDGGGEGNLVVVEGIDWATGVSETILGVVSDPKLVLENNGKEAGDGVTEGEGEGEGEEEGEGKEGEGQM